MSGAEIGKATDAKEMSRDEQLRKSMEGNAVALSSRAC